MAPHNNDLHYATTANVTVTPLQEETTSTTTTETNYKDFNSKNRGDIVNPVVDHDHDHEHEHGHEIMKVLKEQGFTEGLATSLNELQNNFPVRIWVVDVDVDNSGSMYNNRCSKSKEIQEAVEYHVQISAPIKAPTVFQLLNDPAAVSAGSQEFDVPVATKGEDIDITMNSLDSDVSSNTMNMNMSRPRTRPSHCTPLAQHIAEIHAAILAMEDSLRSEGKQAVVVLATDGLPTNEFGKSDAYTRDLFVKSLQKLEGLPVWLLIRISTDEEEAVVSRYTSCLAMLHLKLFAFLFSHALRWILSMFLICRNFTMV